MTDGRIEISAVLDGINAKGSGTVIQLKPDGFITPEDVADLYRLRGRTVAVVIVAPDQPLALDYAEDVGEDGPDGAGLMLAE